MGEKQFAARRPKENGATKCPLDLVTHGLMTLARVISGGRWEQKPPGNDLESEEEEDREERA